MTTNELIALFAGAGGLLVGVGYAAKGIGHAASGLAEWNRSRRQNEKTKASKKPRKRTSGARV